MLPPGNLRTSGRRAAGAFTARGRGALTGTSGSARAKGRDAICRSMTTTERCVHGRERRVLLAHGARSRAQAVHRRGRLARPRARLGRARGARRPDIPAHALAAPARHRLPDPRRRPPVDLRSALRPELARAPRSALPSPGPGTRFSSSRAGRRWIPSTAPVRCGNSPWSKASKNGGAALIVKVHHSLSDGVSGMRMLAVIADPQREPSDLGEMPPVPQGEKRTSSPLSPTPQAEITAQLTRLAWRGAGAAIPALIRSARDPVGAAAAPSRWPARSTGQPDRVQAPCHP